MAGIKSGFIAGARAKIKVGNAVVAFATDVSYDVRVETIPIEAMGKYEVFTNEPVGYYVNGGFTVVRYTAQDSTSTVADQQDGGNQADKIGDGSPKTHIDPQLILESETFDMDIYEKLTESSDTMVYRVKDCRINSRRATLNKRGVLMDSYTFVGVLAGDRNAAESDLDVGTSTVGTDGE